MSTSVSSEPTWRLRTATLDDAPAIATAVQSLLVELDGAPGNLDSMTAVTQAIIRRAHLGVIFLVESDGVLIGLLAASWQFAIHAYGRYALIQDLWVDPAWRSQKIGQALLAAVFDLAKDQSLTRVEVGLPVESFSNFAATHSFYLANGFEPNGPRLRHLLS